MASPEFERLLKAMRARPLTLDGTTVAELRTRFESMALPAEPDIRIGAEQVGDVPVEILTPPTVLAGRTIMYLHGGGYFMGSPRTHRRLAGEIGRLGRASVWLPDYPLAPENPFPAAVVAASRVYQALLRTRRASDVLLAGDSAGAGLALATLVELRDRGVELPAGTALMSPWVDMVSAEPHRPELVDRDPIVTPQILAASRDWYLGEQRLDGLSASPVHQDLDGMPPLLVHVGTSEILLDDARMLRQAAQRHRLDLTYREWPEMVHVFHAFTGTVPESTEAVRLMGDFADRVFLAN